MKKLLSIIFGLALAIDCFATGPLPINAFQSGYINFTTNSPAYTSVTNTFAPGYSYPPAMTFYLFAGPTNAVPLTNSFTTTTNFAIQIATPTNCTVFWSATPVSIRISSGSQVVSSVLTTNVSFPFAYAYPPVLSVDQSTTNGSVAITSITTTNFTISCLASNTIYWGGIGSVLNPGPATVTY